MLLAPVHVLFLVLQIFLHHVEGGEIVLDAVHALAQQLDAVNRHLVVGLQEFDGILVQLLGRHSLLFQFAAQIEQTVDELVHKALLLFSVLQIFFL